MDLVSFLLYFQVAFGIGLVIFVHELGHFIAARMCGVRVETFSLGFGPKILGWKRGPTTYQIALLPLGGYVRMAGEERYGVSEESEHDEVGSKSVGQRFFIYSGGVLMNVVFGLVVFPIVLFNGVPFIEPVVGRAVPGGPAWQAGLEPGTRVLAVNGQQIIGFNYIANEVALGPPDETRMLVVGPGELPEREVVVRPRYDEAVGFNRLAIQPPFDHDLRLDVAPGSAAEAAGLRSGDHLIGVDSGLSALPLVEQLQAALSPGRGVSLTVRRGEQVVTASFEPEVRELPRGKLLGISPLYGLVEAVRAGPEVQALGLLAGDRVLRIDGRPIRRQHDVARALVGDGVEGGPLRLDVVRGGRGLELTTPAAVEPAGRLRLLEDIAFKQNLDGTAVAVEPESAAARAGLLDGDRILRVGGVSVADWSEVHDGIQAHERSEAPLAVAVERTAADGSTTIESLSAVLAPAKLRDYGLGFPRATYVYQATGVGDAVRVGFKSSWKFVVDAWLTLKRILFGQVSSENIGGIITIAAVSYSWAEEGIGKLLFILCMLSMNLAFINVLPIPVLDGGHLFFLLVEKIKGSPVSERVLGYSQVVGAVLILSLMIYVTYNDLVRWFFSG